MIGDYGDTSSATCNTDSNCSSREKDVANMVKSWNPEFIVTLGDNNHSDNPAGDDQYIGQYYHDYIGAYAGAYGAGAGPDLASNKFWPAPGNHDWCETTGINSLTHYTNYFTLPTGSGNERYYEFVKGDVRFFMLDIASTFEPDGFKAPNADDSCDPGWVCTQGRWLRDRLAAATEPWKVVLFHLTPYTSSANGSDIFNYATARWPFAAWGANAVFYGHAHNYERLSVDGIPYIINGLGGHPTIHPFTSVIAESQLRYNATNGAMKCNADATTFTCQFFSIAGGAPIDTLSLSK